MIMNASIWFLILLGLVHGNRIENLYSPHPLVSASDVNGKSFLFDQVFETSNPMEMKSKRIGSIGWGPGGSPISSGDILSNSYVLCTGQSKTNPGHCFPLRKYLSNM